MSDYQISLGDYMLCVACDGKAYYDSDTDYGMAEVLALCEPCWRSGYQLAWRKGGEES